MTKFVKLAMIMETKNKKLFYNIKMKWIIPMNHVFEEYRTLLMKMATMANSSLGKK
jgi:hypothetical protein